MSASKEAQVADKHMFAEAFADQTHIEVPAPELGPGVVVHFRPAYRVDDLLAVAATKNWQDPLVLGLLLARLTLVDADGADLVDPEDDTWFQRGADGVALARIARRAGLVERFVLAYRAAPDDAGDAEELSAEGVRRVVADIATAMRLSPETVRGWPLRDLLDVLNSLTRNQPAT